MELENIINQIKLNQFNGLLDELELHEKYSDVLRENGFDEWSSIIELTQGILEEIGVSNSLDCKQIMACVCSADSIQINLDELESNGIVFRDYQESQEIKEEYPDYESENNDGIDNFDEADETLGIELKKRFSTKKKMVLTKTVLEKASYQSMMRNEKLHDFSNRIISLYLMNKGYDRMVKSII